MAFKNQQEVEAEIFRLKSLPKTNPPMLYYGRTEITNIETGEIKYLPLELDDVYLKPVFD